MKNIILLSLFNLAFTFHTLGQNNAQKFTVDGIPVILKPTMKDIIDVSVYYRGGVSDYTSYKAGIANLAISGNTECGTKNYPKDAFKDMADKYGIDIYGYSSYDYSRINLNCISKYFDEGWTLLVEAVNNPVYNEKEFDLLKQKILSQIKGQQSNPDSKINLMAIDNTFSGTVYETDPQGKSNIVSSITAANAKDFYYNTLLNKNKIFIVVVGKISKKDITVKIKKAFGAIPSKPYSQPSYSIPEITTNTIHIQPRKLATNYIIGVVNAPKFTYSDFVANRLAFATFNSNLFTEIRIKRNLSYRTYAYTAQQAMPYSIIYVSTIDPKATVDVIVNEINRIKSEGFSEKEFTNSRNLFITNNYMEEQSSYDLASSLGNAEILGNWKMPEEFINRVQKTSPHEMSAVFRKYVNGINWNYLGDEKAAAQAKNAFNKKVL